MIASAPADRYSDPVGSLLRIGERRDPLWPDYPSQYRLDRTHVDDLVRMATDPELKREDTGPLEVWGPIHASRALGQLGATEAVPALFAGMSTFDGDEIQLDELRDVLAAMGPQTIPHIATFIEETESGPDIGLTWVFNALVGVGKAHPEHRAECVAILIRKLEQDDSVEPVTNGHLIASLLDLEAVEALDAIRGAFARNMVDQSIPGDLEDCEIALGVRKERATPRPNYHENDNSLKNLATIRKFAMENKSALMAALPGLFDNAKGKGSKKVGRNDPCPCGSGKKYKKCCWAA